ncbi:MAG: hypothetical protein RLZ47_1617 [Bacteroidota bacterium]
MDTFCYLFSDMNHPSIIIGGGCAGMQLIRQLLKMPHDQTGDILLIEKEKSIPGKSWCFWANKPSEYDFLVSKRWHKIAFHAEHIHLAENIQPYAYHYISSEDFFDFHYELIRKSARVKIINEQFESVQQTNGLFTVKTDRNDYQASRVFNSVTDFTHPPANTILLWQHFYGWFIQTEKPVFDQEAATLMDFSIEQGPGANFMYVLPFSANTALVEFTAFSSAESYPEEVYTRQLESYIQKHWNTQYVIERTESGKIPMSNFPFSLFNDAGAINIGAAAGAIKPTTGYAFKRIMKDTQGLNHLLFDQKERKAISSERFKFYDQLLLQIIQNQPERVREIMTKLFSKNDWISVLKFLDEDSSLLEEISIFSSLPKRLFLKQVYQYVRGR